MIKTVILDLGGTIVPLDFESGYRAIAALCSTPLAEIPSRIASSDLIPRFERGEVSPDEFFVLLADLVGMTAPFERFAQAWNSIFPPHTLIPGRLVEELSKQHRILLLSNTNSMHFEFIRAGYPILSHFDGFVLSYEVGAMKPSPRIYREAIARAGCAPGECFFTDDVPAYVEAARGEGIDAVQFRSAAHLVEDLRARGLRLDGF